MPNSVQLKQIVKEKYARIAATSTSCGCGCSASDSDPLNMSEDYSHLEGYTIDADLGLGCGIPAKFANINTGDVVLDLGSGAGNDVFVARALVGEAGYVIGIDMTPEMIDKANRHNTKLGYQNVVFRLGDIENLPVEDNRVDVIISNCVLNLVPNKRRAFAEMFRVLKPGGHFCVSDIVTSGDLPPRLKKSAEMYAGCVAGAVQKEVYQQLITEAGFTQVEIKEERRIPLDPGMLKEPLTGPELLDFQHGKNGIYSITVYGMK